MIKLIDLLNEGGKRINEMNFSKAKIRGKDWLGNDMVYVGKYQATPIGAVDNKDDMEAFVRDHTAKHRSKVSYDYGYLEHGGKFVIVQYSKY